MITIHKYQFDIAEKIIIAMPTNGEVLTVQVQYNTPTMWVKVDTDRPNEVRTFSVFGTGHAMNPLFDYKYINTIHINGFVWHIFE